MKKRILLVIGIPLLLLTFAYGQTKGFKTGAAVPDTVAAINSQNANLYNQITNIFQASVRNGILSGNTGELQLTSSIFGIDEVFHKGKFSDIDYLNKKFERNFNISFIIGADKNNRIVSFAPSLKYSIVNNRDPKNFHNAAPSIYNKADDANSKVAPALQLLAQKISATIDKVTDTAKRRVLKEKFHKIDYKKDTTADLLDNELISYGVDLNDNDILNAKKAILDYQDAKKAVKDLIAAISKGSLLTVQGGSLFKNNTEYGINGKLEYLVGLGYFTDPSKPWDFDTYVSANIGRDSLSKSTNWNRQVYSGYVGANLVLLSSTVQPNKGVATESDLEIRGSTGMDYIPYVRFNKEKTWNYNLDFILSVRLTSNLYLPFELKYSPTTSNILGLLKLQFNIPTITK
jgi:hypothetical protein